MRWPRIKVRKGMPSVALNKAEFTKTGAARFHDPAFEPLQTEVAKIVEAAWDRYSDSRKAPYTRPAGAALRRSQLRAVDRLDRGARRHRARRAPAEIQGGQVAHPADQRLDAQRPDLSRRDVQELPAGRDRPRAPSSASAASRPSCSISACSPRSTICTSIPANPACRRAMPLCHWPCSCYPNHSLGQVNDWMNDIYPMWTAAHGVMIVTPVNWYQVPAGLKAMMDRLVCADGGNPDPTSTHGKDPKRAKEIELAGWDYPAPSGGPRLLGDRPRRHGGRRDGAPLPWRIGWATWAWSRPAITPRSTATSATTSPMPPATTRSTRTPSCRPRSATPRVRLSRPCG